MMMIVRKCQQLRASAARAQAALTAAIYAVAKVINDIINRRETSTAEQRTNLKLRDKLYTL